MRQVLLAASLSFFALGVQAQEAPTPLPMDTPTLVAGLDMACSGIGEEAQLDPRWDAYSVRVEFAGGYGQYLAGTVLALSDEEGRAIATVRCSGPWILIKLPVGVYRMSGTLEGQPAASASARVTAPANGQKRVVLRFPDINNQ